VTKERLEHRLHVHPVVVPEAEFVKVHPEVLLRNVVLYAADPALHERPKAFDGIRMNVAKDVAFLGVVDAPMGVAAGVQAGVVSGFVGEDHRGATKDDTFPLVAKAD
jgi:hypothetical protein